MYGTLGSEDWTPNKSVVMASTVVIPSAVLAGIDWLSIQKDICGIEMSREEKIWLGATPGQLTLHIKESAIQLPLAFVADAFSIFQTVKSSKRASKRARLGWAKKGGKEGGAGEERNLAIPPTPTPYFFALARSFVPFVNDSFTWPAVMQIYWNKKVLI